MMTVTNNDAETRRKWGVLQRVVPTEDNDNNSSTKIFRLFMKDDGVFPNNEHHPLLMFQSNKSFKTQKEGEDAIVKDNKWTSPWAWEVFSYNHYHSTAWELLLCVQGGATLLLGGDRYGVTTEVSDGDLILIPPGFVHKQLSCYGGFTLLGAYPTTDCSSSSNNLDTLTGPPTPKQRDNILKCTAPELDPIFGYHISGLY